MILAKPARLQPDAWEERIEAERHGLTQPAVTVGRAVVQLEAGYSYFYKDTEHETQAAHTTPEMLVRVGLSEDIEFRIRWNYAWIFIDEEPDVNGSEDLPYSLKLQLTRQPCCGFLPTSAVELRECRGPVGMMTPGHGTVELRSKRTSQSRRKSRRST